MCRIVIVTVITSCISSMASGGETRGPRSDAGAVVRIEQGGGADSVVIANKNDRWTAKIQSKRGIGSCKLVLEQGVWPRTIEISLAIKDLEGFRVSNGRLRLQCALHIPQPEVFQLDADGKWQEAKSLMQHRVDIKRAGNWINVQLPAVLFTADDSTIEVQWVDFYR